MAKNSDVDLRDEPGHESGLGREADKPTEIPAKGWVSVLKRTKQQVKTDNVSILAAGVAFYLMLSLAPAMVAVLSIYGLVSEPEDAARHIEKLSTALPKDARSLISSQLETATSSSGGKLGIALAISVLAALWSASKGAKALIETNNVAFDEDETRGFFKIRGLSLLFTLGFIATLLIAIGAIAVLPALGDTIGSGGKLAVNIARFPILALLMILSLSVLYRYAPDRDEPRWRWVSLGAIVATVLWLAGSAIFGIYVTRFGKFGETYGTLGAVVVLMLWLFLTAFSILIGAEINAESERQTYSDTTDGKDQPLGRRAAYAADTVGEADPKKPGKPKASGKGRTNGRNIAKTQKSAR
jgi:membrane protein